MSEHVRNVIANRAQTRSTSTACPWYEQFGTTNCLPVGRRRENNICRQCLVGLHLGYRPTAHRRAFIRRSTRCGFCSTNQSTFEELCAADADRRLFRTILSNSDHLLTRFLPDKSVALQNYSLRRRPHNLALPPRLTHLIDCNYINRMLYLNSY
jgi:hypothetical protein